jgi:hypothetical protein
MRIAPEGSRKSTAGAAMWSALTDAVKPLHAFFQALA